MKAAAFFFVIFFSFVASVIEANTTTTTSKSTIKLCGLKRIRRTSAGVALVALAAIKSTAGLGPLAGLDLRNKFLIF